MRDWLAYSFFMLLITFASSQADAYTKDQADKIAEQTFQAVAKNLDLYTESCIFFNLECGLIGNEAWVLRTMKLEAIYHRSPAIVFGSESDLPGSFLIDGQIRIAKTGSKAGDSIHINRDMIVEPNIFGGFNPLTLNKVIAVIVHEMGHHYENLAPEFSFPQGVITQHEQLDIIGAKVSSFVGGRIQRAFVGAEVHPLLDQDADIYFENYIVEGGSGPGDYNYGSQSRTFVRGAFGYIDITQTIASLTRCPKLTIDGQSHVGEPLNLYFETFEKSMAQLEGDEVHLRINIPGTAYLNCLSGNVLDSFKDFRHGVIDLYFKINGESVTFDPGRIGLSIEVPADQEVWSGH